MRKLVQKTLIVAVLGTNAVLAVSPANAAPRQHEHVGVTHEPAGVPEGQFFGLPDWARQTFTRGG